MKSFQNVNKEDRQRDADVCVFSETASVLETRNVFLAALMVTMGFDLKESSGNVFIGDGITCPGGTVTWSFSPRNESGTLEAAKVMALFDDIKWLTDSSNEDPMAYIACAFHNYARLVDRIKQKVPLAVVRKGKRKALVRLDADAAWNGMVEKFLDGKLKI